MTTSTKTEWTPLDFRSNAISVGHGDLFWWEETLERSNQGGYRITMTGGAAMSRRNPVHMNREEAIDWVYENVTDHVTGYHFTREQAEQICDGIDPGKGYRD